MTMFIRLPRKGAMWFEGRAYRQACGHPFEAKPSWVWERGELLLWWRWCHLILTPPGWTAPRAIAAA
jgi:hypothetical protein